MNAPVSTTFSPASERLIIYTCEHAGNDISYLEHEGREMADSDHIYLEQHWGYDIGAEQLTRGFIERTGGIGVFANFSRLICDPNRSVEHRTFIPQSIEERPLSWNLGLSDNEVSGRIQSLYEPFHNMVDAEIERTYAEQPFLFSVHSFTPNYQGETRDMEIAVLFDQYDSEAALFEQLIARHGFQTALNKPYSGYDDLIYSASAHGRKYDIPYLELEVRQDLLQDPTLRQRVEQCISESLMRLLEMPGVFEAGGVATSVQASDR